MTKCPKRAPIEAITALVETCAVARRTVARRKPGVLDPVMGTPVLADLCGVLLGQGGGAF